MIPGIRPNNLAVKQAPGFELRKILGVDRNSLDVYVPPLAIVCRVGVEALFFSSYEWRGDAEMYRRSKVTHRSGTASL